MPWPMPTDYAEAVQRTGVCLADEEFRGSEVARTPLGLPMLWSGNFADVYKVHCPATGNTWALKCFTRQIPGQQERYRSIALHLDQAKLPFTVDFQYQEQGIRIGAERFPLLKMHWVEGLMLNQFVEEHLERPQNLKMLLELWVKLAARLREAGIAHADLQHGNVILVPASGGSLALRLIDYDGMYVPALADTHSGEVGLPAYQHPERIRRGLYNAEVDRFSHLVIYTAIRCLMLGRSALWQRFNTGENLLFRDSDFRRPETSELFRTLWQLDDSQAKALVGRLVLACGQPLEQTPLLQEIVASGGQVLSLGGEERATVQAILDRRSTTGSTTSSQTAPTAAAISASFEPTGPPTAAPTATMTSPPIAPPAPARQPATQAAPWPKWPLAAAIGRFHRFLVTIAGPGRRLQHSLLWAAAVVMVVVCLVVVAKWLHVPAAGTGSRHPVAAQPPAAAATEPLRPDRITTRNVEVGKTLTFTAIPLRLVPIDRQAVEAGKLLMVTVLPERAEHWSGKLRFRLAAGAPAGARINPETGLFTWTPREEQAPDTFDAVVSAAGPEGQTASARLAVSVVQPFRFVPIRPRTVEAGKPLTVAVSVEHAAYWAEKLQFSLASGAPPGASIDGQAGTLTWTPNADETPGQRDVTIFVEGPSGQKARTSLAITVTQPPLGSQGEIAVDLGGGVKLEMVLIPSGDFLMGDKVERPAHRVELKKPLYLGKYEVTQEQWASVMDKYPSRFVSSPRNPVEGISWDDCQEFLNRINDKQRVPRGTFRLPTEAQWEYACRAGSRVRWCFGDDEQRLGDYAWYAKNAAGTTHPVGLKKPNAWGLYDMHGNVWEWCQDWYDRDYYARSPHSDPPGPLPGAECVRRGGSYFNPAGYCGSAHRDHFGADGRVPNLGMRACRIIEESEPAPALREPRATTAGQP